MSATVCNKNHGIRLLTLTTLFASLALAGCSSGMGVRNSVAEPQAVTGLHGYVHGGQQPVSGANVTLWRVNTDGTAATSLLNNGVTITTASNGTFNLTGQYSTASCSATTQVYIMATGGNPGDGGTNSALALMAALGSCLNLPSVSNISINEVSTVAAVFALQQFIGVSEGTAFADDIAIGTTSQSATGMINAFATVPNLVSLSTGTANSTVGNLTLEAAKLNTMANIISSCINSTGGSPCTTLFSAVTPPGSISAGDTIQAALYMAQNPSNNVANIYTLQPTTPPFLPDLSSAPFDFSLAITYNNDGLNLPNLLASDASGNIWITDYASSNAEALVEITPSGNTASGSPFLSGSNVAFDVPQGVVVDTLGNIWISSHGTSGSTGNRLVEYNPTTQTVSKYTNLASNCDPYSIAIDAHDDVFFACSNLGYLYEFVNTTSGTPSTTNLPSYAASPSTASPTQLGPIGTESYGMAIDALNNVWVANTQTSSNPTVTEYASSNYTTAANTFTLGSGPVGIAIDHSNNAWATASQYLNEFAYTSGSYTTSDYTGGGLASGGYAAVDGAGNIWTTSRTAASISGTSYAVVSEFNSSGSPITSAGTTTQPGGLSNTTVSDAAPRGIAIDPSGNVWIAGCGTSTSCSSGTTSFVMEFVGAAAPPTVPFSTALANNQLGCCSFTPVGPTGTSPTDTAGNVSLQTSSGAFTQDNGQFSFEVTRSGGFKGAISVNYSFVNGTATNGTDYTGSNGTLTWADGDSSIRTISVTWNHTSTYTGTKTFTIDLNCSSSCPASFSPYNSELVTITDNLTPPSTAFTFNNATVNYYLGLPIDTYGGTGGTNGSQFAWQTIADTTLAAGFSDPYFYLNGSNQIVFTAPSNGATSSPGAGSNDTRSELREQYYGTGKIDTDDWDSAIGGTLTATCAVNQTAVNSNEATIGQIHGQNQPFVLLQYQPTSSSQGNIVAQVNTTNTTDSPATDYTIATGINLGATFTYKISLSTSGQLTVLVNNASSATMPIAIDSSWLGTCGGSSCTYDDGLYFKLGAYSAAGNTGNPAGDQTQVTFSTFSITHP